MQTQIYYVPPSAPATALACAILSAQADRMDRLARIAELELQKTNRTRDRLDYIIGALIDRLDTIDAATVDLEDADEDCDTLIQDGEGDDADFEPSLGSFESSRYGSGTYTNGHQL